MLPVSYSQDKNFILNSKNKDELLKELEIRLNEEFLNKLIKEIKREQKKNGQGIFTLYSLYNPEKASKIINSVNQLTNERKRYNVFMTIISLMKKGKVSLEDIEVISCDDQNGIVLESKLANGKFLLMANSPQEDLRYSYPIGWHTCVFSENVDKEIIDLNCNEPEVSLYEKAIQFITNKKEEFGNEYISNDSHFVAIGSMAERRYIESNKNYYMLERLVEAKMEELFKEREVEIK